MMPKCDGDNGGGARRGGAGSGQIAVYDNGRAAIYPKVAARFGSAIIVMAFGAIESGR